jgi:hypothetical protein
MLQMRNTRLYKSLFEALASGTSVQEEGVALTFVKENGETKVEIGVAGGKFAGVAIARNMPPATLPLVEEGAIPASGAGKLTRAPNAGALLVKIDGAVAALVAAAPAAGEVEVVGDSYTFNVADAGKVATFQYQYTPSVVEARSVIGDTPYGGLAANALATIATIKQGEIATSFFDASADWSNALYAKVIAGGMFAPATASTGIQGVTVKNSPTAGNPFLVLELNIG